MMMMITLQKLLLHVVHEVVGRTIVPSGPTVQFTSALPDHYCHCHNLFIIIIIINDAIVNIIITIIMMTMIIIMTNLEGFPAVVK